MAIDPKEYVIKPGAKIRDVDLDQETFTYQGQRLTEARAAELADQGVRAAQTRNLVPGGKSLSGGAKHSPVVQFRVPEKLRRDAEQLADETGVTVSRLARRALEEYISARRGA